MQKTHTMFSATIALTPLVNLLSSSAEKEQHTYLNTRTRPSALQPIWYDRYNISQLIKTCLIESTTNVGQRYLQLYSKVYVASNFEGKEYC